MQKITTVQPPSEVPDLLTIPQVAKKLGVSRTKAFEMASKGTFFKVLRIGDRNLRVHPADLITYIEQLRQEAVS